jgi:hypothetical protein
VANNRRAQLAATRFDLADPTTVIEVGTGIGSDRDRLAILSGQERPERRHAAGN